MRPPQADLQGDLEFAKWVALASMVVEHYGKIVDPGLALETHAVGRLAFPLFAMIIGMRLAARPSMAVGYMRRLLPWAVVSQPVFVLVRGGDWLHGNILLTLLLGVVATAILHRQATGEGLPAEAAAFLWLVPASYLVDYGPLGVAIVPATALLATRSSWLALASCGPLGLLANGVPAWPALLPVDGAALLASLVALASVRARLPLPRLPIHAVYAFYPLHLLLLPLLERATNQ